MDFFEHQEQAQRRTKQLILLFALALMLVVLAVYMAVSCGWFVATFFEPQHWHWHGFWNQERFIWVSSCTLAILLLGSWYKIYQLQQHGGASVAEALGGKRLPQASNHILHRRLLHIVEEMAIASGLPVPSIYLLEQQGINAFAAGFSPSDTVIGVTEGAINMLSRTQLQSVIGHEFSHILHGDTRINMHMLGLLHGLTLVSDIGMAFIIGIKRTTPHHKRYGSHPALWVLGFLIFLVGTIGMIAADLIKFAISRQREFLADAAAVQFTRNPQAMVEALKIIGGYTQGAAIHHPKSITLSYFFFAHAATTGAPKNWWASHPPLSERIHRIDPHAFTSVTHIHTQKQKQRVTTEAQVGVHFMMSQDTLPAMSVEDVMQSIGTLSHQGLPHATHEHHQFPISIQHGIRDPYTAQALCYAMLFSLSHDISKKQWAYLEQHAENSVLRELLDIQHDITSLNAHLRLSLMTRLIPTLKELSHTQYTLFTQNIAALMRADHNISMFEYALQRMLLRHVRPAFTSTPIPHVRYRHIRDVQAACACILAIFICYGHHKNNTTLFHATTKALLGTAMPWPPKPMLGMPAFNQSLTRMEHATPALKRKLLHTCMQVAVEDGRLHAHEMAALRAIADGMDCPIPASFSG